MEDVEFPRVRRFNLDKFLDQFAETDRDLRVLFVNYSTNVPLDFKNLEREINQNAGRNFKQKEVKLFGMEYTIDSQKVIWNNRTIDNYEGIALPRTKKGVMESF